MLAIPARLWAVAIGPIGAGPSATGWQEHDEVEVAVRDSGQPLVLGGPVEEVVGLAAHQDVNLEDDQTDALGRAHPAQVLCD